MRIRGRLVLGGLEVLGKLEKASDAALLADTIDSAPAQSDFFRGVQSLYAGGDVPRACLPTTLQVLLGEQREPVELRNQSEAILYTRLARYLASRNANLDPDVLELLGPALSQTPTGQLTLALRDSPRLARQALLQPQDQPPVQLVAWLQRQVGPEETDQRAVLTGWLVDRMKEGTRLQSGASLLDLPNEAWVPGAIEGYLGQSDLQNSREALIEAMADELIRTQNGRHQLLEMPDRPWLSNLIKRYIQKGGLGPHRLTAADTCENLDDLRYVLRADLATKPTGSLIGQHDEKLIVGSVALRQRNRS